jgi:hypothetical protein
MEQPLTALVVDQHLISKAIVDMLAETVVAVLVETPQELLLVKPHQMEHQILAAVAVHQAMVDLELSSSDMHFNWRSTWHILQK